MMRWVIISVFLISILIPVRAYSLFGAGDIVYDPANFIQNAITRAQTALSNAHEIRMIEQNVRRILQEAKNLRKLKLSTVDDLSFELNELFRISGEIQGIMQDITSVEEYIDEHFPDFYEQEEVPTRREINEATDKWLSDNRRSIKSIAKTGSQVLNSMPRTQEQLESLGARSGDSIGNLQVQQVGNEIRALAVGENMKLTTLLSNYIQMMTSKLAKTNSSDTLEQKQTEKFFPDVSRSKEKNARENSGDRFVTDVFTNTAPGHRPIKSVVRDAMKRARGE